MHDVTKVLIADDHPIFREGLVRAIEREQRFNVVAQAGEGAEALRLIGELHPDVAVLDVSMPHIDGLEVARRVHQSALPTQVVILTMYKDAVYFHAALDVGVRGYVLKDGAVTQLLHCLVAVVTGEYYISPELLPFMADREARSRLHITGQTVRERLSPAEMSIFRLVGENRTSREIAEMLFVSVRTVENHRTHICQKLGLKGAHALLQFAIQNKEIT